MTPELREGLAKAMFESWALPDLPWEKQSDVTRNAWRSYADAALAYLRAHDGHAEFARKVREIAVRGLGSSAPWANLREIQTMCDAELAELAKEQSK